MCALKTASVSFKASFSPATYTACLAFKLSMQLSMHSVKCMSNYVKAGAALEAAAASPHAPSVEPAIASNPVAQSRVQDPLHVKLSTHSRQCC